MAKKKKQDANKKAVLQAQKEAKQATKAQKRISKQQQKSSRNNSTNEDDDTDNDTDGRPGSSSISQQPIVFDQIIATYRNHDKKIAGLDKPMIEDLDSATTCTSASATAAGGGAGGGGSSNFPLPRANATFEYVGNSNHLYLFGGEYFDGVENIVLDELLRYDVLKQEWKHIMTVEPRPPARCAHVCRSYKSSLYVFGGELATADQYHHYRDLWKFDTKTLSWKELTAKHPPSARSGMGCVIWKHYMIIFGGFFEAARETK